MKNDIANVKSPVRYHPIKIPHITNLLGIFPALFENVLSYFFNWSSTDDRYTVPASPGPSYGKLCNWQPEGEDSSSSFVTN